MVKSVYTCKSFWKYKNLILKFSFLKRARQTFKESYFIQLAEGEGWGRGGVIFVSETFWRTSINDIHRASLRVFEFSLRF